MISLLSIPRRRRAFSWAVLVFILLVARGSARAAWWSRAPLAQSVPVQQAAPAPRVAAGKLLLAGDGVGRVWMAVPTVIGGKSPQIAFVLLVHPVSRRNGKGGLWHALTAKPLLGTPAALAAVPATRSRALAAGAYVFFPDGTVKRYSAHGSRIIAPLPGQSRIVAAAASGRSLYVLSFGAPPNPRKRSPSRAPATTRPAVAAPASPPASMPSAMTKPAPQPSAAASTAPTSLWHVCVFRNRKWTAIPLALPGAAPSALALGAITINRSHVLVAFTPRDYSIHLHITELFSAAPGAGWSKPTIVNTGSPIREVALLTLDGQSTALWIHATGNGATLDGVGVRRDGTLNPHARFARTPLGAVGYSAAIANNCALAADSDSIMLALRAANGSLQTTTFAPSGQVVAAASTVQPRLPRQAPTSTLQEIIMAAVFLLVVVFIFQRRQRANALVLPPDMEVAPIYARASAAAIDIAIPLIGVAIYFHLDTSRQWEALLRDWIRLPLEPEPILRNSALLWGVGLYTLHVMIGEMLFSRSIGKAAMGMRVIRVDGRKMPVGAAVVRNVIRVLELVSGLFLFLLFNDNRQRLGDLISQTVVVRKKTGVPVDAGAPKEDHAAKR